MQKKQQPKWEGRVWDGEKQTHKYINTWVNKQLKNNKRKETHKWKWKLSTYKQNTKDKDKIKNA